MCLNGLQFQLSALRKVWELCSKSGLAQREQRNAYTLDYLSQITFLYLSFFLNEIFVQNTFRNHKCKLSCLHFPYSIFNISLFLDYVHWFSNDLQLYLRWTLFVLNIILLFIVPYIPFLVFKFPCLISQIKINHFECLVCIFQMFNYTVRWYLVVCCLFNLFHCSRGEVSLQHIALALTKRLILPFVQLGMEPIILFWKCIQRMHIYS